LRIPSITNIQQVINNSNNLRWATYFIQK
jgi:hypothetical protein